MPSVTLELAQRANALALEVSEQRTPQTPAPSSIDERITAALTDVEPRCRLPSSVRAAASVPPPSRASRRPHRRRPPRQVRSRLSPRRSLTALARQSSREHSHNRHDIALAAHFRFRLSLQRRGSGSRKSKMLPRHVPCRHAGIARLPPRCNPSVRSAPSFHPDLHAPRAGARSGGQGWPVFGPPRQRREASLTAASTTASSIESGL
jgi:hypothetical protein